MDKQQVEKHGEVIKWWVDNPDKGVWWSNNAKDWTLCKAPSFNMAMYVQNDEYADLRKAQADGKIIQQSGNKSCKTWDDIKYKPSFNRNPEVYRIKPDEPEFKIGDWIRNKAIDEPYVYKIFDIVGDKYYIYMTNNLQQMKMSKSKAELWKPQKGEWCVFWDDDMEDYVLSQYNYEAIGGHACAGKHIRPFANMAPLEFIQSLRDK